MIRNERFHYISTKHGQELFHKILNVSSAIKDNNKIEIQYKKHTTLKVVERKIEPLSIIFPEFYFLFNS